MKKIWGLICVFTIVFSVMQPLDVFSARGGGVAEPWAGWTTTGNASISDSVGTVKSVGSLDYAYGNQPLKMTVSFSMRVLGNCSSQGLQIVDGVCRAGFYVQTNRFMSMDTGQFVMAPNMNEWHEYVLEIDMEKAKQTIFIDDMQAGVMDLRPTAGRSRIFWWSELTGGHIEIENFSVASSEKTSGEELLELTSEYTEAFFFDFNERGGWTYENEKSVTRNDEEGIIRLSSGPLFDDHTSNTLHTLERPLRPPANYDVEWRMKLTDIAALGGQPAMTALELSTDNRHTWLYIYEEKIWHNGFSIDENSTNSGYALPYNVQDNQWHNWKAEVRSNYITWYLDGQVLMNYRIMENATGRWHLLMFQQHTPTLSSDAFFDWVKYTPYFDEVELTSPLNQSEVEESKDIILRANAPQGTEYVDYYVGDISIGRGYAPDFKYVLKDTKVGTYEFYAKAGDRASVKSTVYVRRAFDAKLKLSKEHIVSGEEVTAKVESSWVSAELKPIKAEYFVNGKSVAVSTQAPFEVSLSGFRIGSSTVFAKVTNQDGATVTTEPVFINADWNGNEDVLMGREYKVAYNYDSGDGKIELTDGYFRFSISHSEGKLLYQTKDGEKEYPLGAGEYKAVVTAGYAEVYYNGQFAFSFFMPTDCLKTKVTQSSVENLQIGSSGVKSEIWSKEVNGETSIENDDISDTQYYSIEFDKKDSSEETLVFYDGIFENEVYFRGDGIYANRQLTLQAPKTEVKLSNEVKPGYYRLTVGFGIAQLFRDNEFLGSYRCNKFGHKPMFKREMSNPSATTFVALKNTDDVYYHEEDFEGRNEIPYEDYFQMRVGHFKDGASHSMKQSRVTKNGNSYLKLDGTGVYMLNGYARNPVLKFRVMTERRSGNVYFTVRRSIRGDVQDRIGYDFEKSRWYFAEYDENGAYKTTVAVNDANMFEAGVWYDFEIKFDDQKVKLLCNGTEVISAEESGNEYEVFYGKMGFGAVDGSLCIDDIYYAGENRVTAGLITNQTKQYQNSGMLSTFYKRDDGIVVGTGGTVTAETTDGGNSWKFEPAASTDNIVGAQVVKLPDGNFVKLNESVTSTSQISTNGGKSWEKPVRMWYDDFVLQRSPASSVSRLTATKDGKLYMITSQGDEDYGYSDIWYSEDGAKSWKKSETVLTTHNTGIVMNESIVVDTPRENEVWMYGRSDSGFLDYWISYDGGKTFDLTPHHSQLIQSETCFKIIRDWQYDEVYYAVFHYDTETSNERGQQMPRNKASLAVSYDGMETWEYITDILETNLIPGLHTSDSNIALVDNYLYYRMSDYSGVAGDVIGSQNLDKIKTLKRHPQLHERYFMGFEAHADYAVNHCVIPKTGGEGYIYGDYYNMTVVDGKIDCESIKRVFGVTAEKISNGIQLKMGDAVVSFTENSNSYTVNGDVRSSDKVCCKGGLLDIELCAKLFGKAFRETESSYSVLYQQAAVEQYQQQIDGLI